jgi:hypothetical protein
LVPVSPLVFSFTVYTIDPWLKACDLTKKPKAVQDHVINSTISHLANVFGIQFQELENRQAKVVCFFIYIYCPLFLGYRIEVV